MLLDSPKKAAAVLFIVFNFRGEYIKCTPPLAVTLSHSFSARDVIGSLAYSGIA